MFQGEVQVEFIPNACRYLCQELLGWHQCQQQAWGSKRPSLSLICTFPCFFERLFFIRRHRWCSCVELVLFCFVQLYYLSQVKVLVTTMFVSNVCPFPTPIPAMRICTHVRKPDTRVVYTLHTLEKRTAPALLHWRQFHLNREAADLVYPCASLNHNEICRIPYENASRTGVRNLPNETRV